MKKNKKYRIDFEIDFRRNETPGTYIAFEGIDGSGKTTQVEQLAIYFENQGKTVVKTREPRKNEGIIGRMIAEILKGNVLIPSAALQYLFTADRVMHYNDVILPAKEVVISDRCFWSAVPYGILDRMKGQDYNFSDGKIILVAQSILWMYHEFLIPDYTFFLDIPVELGLERIGNSRNEKELLYETREKLDKIILGYNWLLKEFPEEIIKLNAQKNSEEVTENIIHILESQNT